MSARPRSSGVRASPSANSPSTATYGTTTTAETAQVKAGARSPYARRRRWMSVWLSPQKRGISATNFSNIHHGWRARIASMPLRVA